MKITIEETIKDQTLDKLMTSHGDIKPEVIGQEDNTVIDYDSNANAKVTVQD